jgi:hypothetical protein
LLFIFALFSLFFFILFLENIKNAIEEIIDVEDIKIFSDIIMSESIGKANYYYEIFEIIAKSIYLDL